MKVVSIDVHVIEDIGNAEWCSYTMRHINGNGITKRCIYVAKSDTGHEGIGEYHDQEPEDVVAQYIGSNPFDWLADTTSLPLGMAMYDLMGKITGVPCWKLFGAQARLNFIRRGWSAVIFIDCRAKRALTVDARP
jgi:L-alanine-DL-glutamate epimerase-like enolase superfamily enzyme